MRLIGRYLTGALLMAAASGAATAQQRDDRFPIVTGTIPRVAVMRGSPEAPDWPLHSGALADGTTATRGMVPVTIGKRSSRCCAVAAPLAAAIKSAPVR